VESKNKAVSCPRYHLAQIRFLILQLRQAPHLAGSSRSYLRFQLKYIAWPMSALRQISAKGVSSLPGFGMKAFGASEDVDALVARRSSPASRFQRKTPASNGSILWAQTVFVEPGSPGERI
jgi:hypothetical protein